MSKAKRKKINVSFVAMQPSWQRPSSWTAFIYFFDDFYFRFSLNSHVLFEYRSIRWKILRKKRQKSQNDKTNGNKYKMYDELAPFAFVYTFSLFLSSIRQPLERRIVNAMTVFILVFILPDCVVIIDNCWEFFPFSSTKCLYFFYYCFCFR